MKGTVFLASKIRKHLAEIHREAHLYKNRLPHRKRQLIGGNSCSSLKHTARRDSVPRLLPSTEVTNAVTYSGLMKGLLP